MGQLVATAVRGPATRGRNSQMIRHEAPSREKLRTVARAFTSAPQTGAKCGLGDLELELLDRLADLSPR